VAHLEAGSRAPNSNTKTQKAAPVESIMRDFGSLQKRSTKNRTRVLLSSLRMWEDRDDHDRIADCSAKKTRRRTADGAPPLSPCGCIMLPRWGLGVC